MVWFVAAACLALVAAIVGFARLAPDPSQRRIRGDRIARRYRLHVDPEDVPAFDRLLDHERRGRYASLVLIPVVFGGCLLAAATGLPDSTVLAVLYVGVVLACWAPTLLTSGLETTSKDTAGPGLVVLVHPALWAGLGTAAVAGLATAIWAATSPSPWAEPATVAVALVPVWGLLLAYVGEGLVARRPLPDGRAGWRYAALAMRSESVTGSCYATILVEYLALAQALEHQDAFGPALVVLVAMFAFILGALVPRFSHLYFRERLWPDLPRSAVVSTAAVRLP